MNLIEKYDHYLSKKLNKEQVKKLDAKMSLIMKKMHKEGSSSSRTYYLKKSKLNPDEIKTIDDFEKYSIKMRGFYYEMEKSPDGTKIPHSDLIIVTDGRGLLRGTIHGGRGLAGSTVRWTGERDQAYIDTVGNEFVVLFLTSQEVQKELIRVILYQESLLR